VRSLLLFLACTLAACAPRSELEPTTGDLVPEQTLSADAILARFEPVGGWWTSEVLDAPAGATRVGVLLDLAPDATLPLLEARGFDADGSPGAWQPFQITWSEDRQHVARAELSMDAFSAQLRVDRPSALTSLTWSAVVPLPPAADRAPAVSRHVAALRPELSDLVRDRASWGARATTCTSRDESKYRIAIHHTVTPASTDPATRLRGIQAFHMDTRGWCDIGYHFLISLDGTVWEGRELELLGTHVGGNNTGNIGISFIGCFHSSGCNDWTPFDPPDAMVDSAATMVSRLADLYGIAISPTSVKGHRDHDGASTSCPGDNLHARLDDIRAGGDVEPTDILRASYVNQTFPLASADFELAPGETFAGEIELRNDGNVTWEPGTTFLGTTEPRDGDSPLAADDWVAPNRPATVSVSVPPGSTGRFLFSVRGPFAAGEYPQFFNLVHDGTWFSAPADDQLQVRVTVARDGDAGPPATDAGPPPAVDAGSRPTADAGSSSDASLGAEAGPGAPLSASGCACDVPGSRGASPLLGALLLGGLALVRRRRS